MTETEAIAEIDCLCRTRDFEANGVALDHIIDQFLRANGLDRLADVMRTVECWRS